MNKLLISPENCVLRLISIEILYLKQCPPLQ